MKMKYCEYDGLGIEKEEKSFYNMDEQNCFSSKISLFLSFFRCFFSL